MCCLLRAPSSCCGPANDPPASSRTGALPPRPVVPFAACFRRFLEHGSSKSRWLCRCAPLPQTLHAAIRLHPGAHTTEEQQGFECPAHTGCQREGQQLAGDDTRQPHGMRPDRNMLYAGGAIKLTNPLASG